MLKTIDYGILGIAKEKEYLTLERVGEVLDCNGDYYLITKTCNGVLVAILDN